MVGPRAQKRAQIWASGALRDGSGKAGLLVDGYRAQPNVPRLPSAAAATPIRAVVDSNTTEVAAIATARRAGPTPAPA